METQLTYAEKVAEVQAHLRSGGIVQTVTYTRATNYDKRHVEWFSADASGWYVRQGRGNVCLNFTNVRFGRMVKK